MTWWIWAIGLVHTAVYTWAYVSSATKKEATMTYLKVCLAWGVAIAIALMDLLVWRPG